MEQRKVCVGFVIGDKAGYGYHSNVKAYKTEAVAMRYSHGRPVFPAFIFVTEEQVTPQVWAKSESV